MSGSTLRALARVQDVLLTPQAFADDVCWRSCLAEELLTLFGAAHALVLLPGAVRPYVGAGFDDSTLTAMAAFLRPPRGRGPQRVAYRDVTLARLHEHRMAAVAAAEDRTVFTRRRNEALMGRSVEGTSMFDAVCRPLRIADFHGVFSSTPDGDVMVFVAHGRRVGRGTRVGDAAVPLLRVLAPAVASVTDRLTRSWGRFCGSAGAAPAGTTMTRVLPDNAVLRARFGLTPREADVARAIAYGWTRHQIAGVYGISGATVRHHTEAVFCKLDVQRRGAVALALMVGQPGRDTLD